MLHINGDYVMEYKSGQTVPQSGIYGMYNAQNKKCNEVTCVKGELFPPTPSPDMHYKLVRATK